MSTPAPADASTLAFVAALRKAVESRLKEHLDAFEQSASEAGTEPHAIASAVTELVRRGGKRLRPALMIAAHRACGGGDDVRAVIDVGCAWELLQAYFLIHDDWMDGDATRRGGPSVHAALSDRYGDPHRGAATAILAGDLACAMAHRIVASVDAPAEVVREAALAFARVHEDVVLGQALDLTQSADDHVSLERMHALKTASYTVRGPLELGAIFANAGEEAHDALANYGDAVGIAFQLRDDLLGAFGDPAQTGKPVGSDVRAQKRTALYVEARTRASEDDVAMLDALMSAPAIGDDDVAWIGTLYEHCGAREAVEARIAALVAEGIASLDVPSITPIGARLLQGLASILTNRSA